MKTNTISIVTLLMSACMIGFSGAALAQETLTPQAPLEAVPEGKAAQIDILPVKSAEDADVVLDESSPTHAAIKLTPDRSELIRLDRKATVVLVGNPAHLSILPEGANTLVLVPKAPGATYFTVLDEENKVIMQRHVIVASPKEKYVRIRKSCANAKECAPTAVYYCPDMCHEIILNAGQSDKGSNSGKGNATTAPSISTEPAADEAAETENTEAGPNEGGEEETTE